MEQAKNDIEVARGEQDFQKMRPAVQGALNRAKEISIKELDNNSEIKKQINSFIDKQPDIAAGMLRNWIYENDK